VKNEKYPPIGSRWKDNDPRMTREVVVLAHDTTNRRARVKNAHGKSETWVRVEAFYSNAQRGFSEVQA
jgi:hypothetical protein